MQIGVSTKGGGPRLGARIRDAIVRGLDPLTPDAVVSISRLRAKFRKVDDDLYPKSGAASEPQIIESRGKWISKFCDSVNLFINIQWSTDDLIKLEDDELIVDAYRKRLPVPLPAERKETEIKPEELVIKNTFTYEPRKEDVLYTLKNDLIIKSVENIPVIGAFILYFICIWISFQVSVIKLGISALRIISSQNAAISPPEKGAIYLVGSGPGHPDYLVAQALDLLKSADIVVSDRLISPQILSLVPQTRLHLAIWKKNGLSEVSQEKTNQICLRYLNMGKTVVRLKSGDPFIFGRGAEEVLKCFY